MIKFKTYRTSGYPGDTFRRIDAHLPDGRIIPVIGIYRERGVWANDTNGRTFSTITAAKEYATMFYNQNH